MFCALWTKPWEGQTWQQLALIVCCQEGCWQMLRMLPFLPLLPKVIQAFILLFYSPRVSCLTVILYFNVITVRLALSEKFVCGFLCRIHACKLFNTGLFLLLFYSCNLCISWITSAKYEKKHKGISICVQHTLIHIIYKLQNFYFSPDGSSLRILNLYPKASKGKQYHWDFKAMQRQLKKSMSSRV